MILIPSVSAERAAGVSACTGRPARRKESHNPSRHRSVKVAPLLTAPKLSASENQQSDLPPQRWAVHRNPHHSPGGARHADKRTCSKKNPLAASKARETTSAAQRHDFRVRSVPPNARTVKSSNRKKAEIIRECPYDEMHSAHHREAMWSASAALSSRFPTRSSTREKASPVATEILEEP